MTRLLGRTDPGGKAGGDPGELMIFIMDVARSRDLTCEQKQALSQLSSDNVAHPSGGVLKPRLCLFSHPGGGETGSERGTRDKALPGREILEVVVDPNPM
eukprot:344665-Amphidinium_carterae.1